MAGELCCRGKRQRDAVRKVCLVRGVIGETRVQPAGVVEVEVAADAGRGGRHGMVGVEIDLFVLERAPERFDEDVVAPAAVAQSITTAR